MREQLGALRLVVATAWRVDRRRSLGTLLEPAGQLAYPLFGLWLALLADGVAGRDTVLVAIGAGGITASEVLLYAGNVLGVSIRLTLAERVGHAFDLRIAAVCGGLPGLEHLERRDYQDRLELLRQTQGVLGQSLDALVRTTNAMVTAVVTLGLLAGTDPYLLALVCFCLPSIALARLQAGWARRAEESSAEPRRLARHLRELIGDHGAGAEIRIWGLQAELLARHRQAWLASQDPLLRAQRRRAAISLSEQCLFALGFGGAMVLTLWQASRGRASIGEVLLVAVVGLQVPAQVLGPIYSVADLGRVLRSAGRLGWLEAHASQARDTWRGRQPAPGRLRSGIVMEGVSFGYAGRRGEVIEDVSAELPAGSVVALVGHNGAGKTTLVKLLCGLYTPSGGRILVDGVDLASIDVSSWRARLTGAFQDFARLELVARRSIGVGDLPRMDCEPAVRQAAQRAGAAGVLASLPAGLSTQLGAGWDDGVEPSVGQWQAVASSRALMRDDAVLVVLDEPTASLDGRAEAALYARYAEAVAAGRARGAITLLVSHRLSMVRMADHILVLDQGRLVEQGRHEALLRRHGRYAELYALHREAYR